MESNSANCSMVREEMANEGVGVDASLRAGWGGNLLVVVIVKNWVNLLTWLLIG